MLGCLHHASTIATAIGRRAEDDTMLGNTHRLNRRTFMGATVAAAASVAFPTVFAPNASLAVATHNRLSPPSTPTAPAVTSGVGEHPLLEYHNQYATRNRPCTETLERCLLLAAGALYGRNVGIEIYSGGQPAKGTSGARTGSIRHDDQGHGGRAADIRIRRSDGMLSQGRSSRAWVNTGLPPAGVASASR